MIELTDLNTEKPMLVNPQKISTVRGGQGAPGGTVLRMDGGESVPVKESYDEVKEKLKEAGCRVPESDDGGYQPGSLRN
jgi:uncharacterized protein YlzI (FlbEa/FlbD family)